jgi:hypothetical protein
VKLFLVLKQGCGLQTRPSVAVNSYRACIWQDSYLLSKPQRVTATYTAAARYIMLIAARHCYVLYTFLLHDSVRGQTGVRNSSSPPHYCLAILNVRFVRR